MRCHRCARASSNMGNVNLSESCANRLAVLYTDVDVNYTLCRRPDRHLTYDHSEGRSAAALAHGKTGPCDRNQTNPARMPSRRRIVTLACLDSGREFTWLWAICLSELSSQGIFSVIMLYTLLAKVVETQQVNFFPYACCFCLNRGS